MFLSLDFLYVPSKPPGPVIAYYTEVLGGTLQFRVKAMGTEVAAVKLSEEGPLVLLAEHLEGSLPILIYRVGNLSGDARAGAAPLEAGRGVRDSAWPLLHVYG
ncbi:MAG TPA: hypothetical protein VFT63_02070 [bacterium]|nr:hypothetical protein [bacterium]